MTAACDTRRSAGTVRIVGIVRTTTDLAANSFQQSIFFAATGARFALEAGPAARRLPVRSTLGAAVAAVTVVVDLLVVAVSLDGLLGTPARYGAPWAAGVPVDLEAPRQDAATLAGDPRVDEASLIATGGLTVRPAAGWWR